MGKTYYKTCNNALFYTQLAWPRIINVRIPMVYLKLQFASLLMRKRNVNCGPAMDRLGCSISIKMASQTCGGTIANKPILYLHSQSQLWLYLYLCHWIYRSQILFHKDLIIRFMTNMECKYAVVWVIWLVIGYFWTVGHWTIWTLACAVPYLWVWVWFSVKASEVKAWSIEFDFEGCTVVYM